MTYICAVLVANVLYVFNVALVCDCGHGFTMCYVALAVIYLHVKGEDTLVVTLLLIVVVMNRGRNGR